MMVPSESTAPDAATPKAAALEAAAGIITEVTGMVEYRSEGRLLLIGSGPQVTNAVAHLTDSLKPRALLTEPTGQPPEWIPLDWASADEIEISGYLGAFVVTTPKGHIETDLILDLTGEPLLPLPLPPPGYLAPGDAETSLTEAIAQLAELTGRFDKPQFFRLNPDICAHGASGLTGCTRCLDACPAEAIFSIGDKVEVNPYLCQGGGVCTTVCPTGAISYAYPPASDNLDRLRRMLRAWREAGGAGATIIFHTDAFDTASLQADELPVVLEELASVGLELWLAALTYGARKVLLVRDAGIPDKVLDAVQEQRFVANTILSGLGMPAAIQWYGADQAEPMPAIHPATFGAGSGGKREVLFAALDHLVEQADQAPASMPLPAGAPLGRLEISAGCTLCMACVSVCPAKALADGDGVPALRFYESNCVQCGLCATACPEQVIKLVPRLLTSASERRKVAVLNEESPFLCVRCSKPFATLSVIDRMIDKLAGHSMFQDEAAINRLRMCGDCRVIDMMQDDA